MKIANKVFIITGGASGLGAASAKRIVAAGGKVGRVAPRSSQKFLGDGLRRDGSPSELPFP